MALTYVLSENARLIIQKQVYPLKSIYMIPMSHMIVHPSVCIVVVKVQLLLTIRSLM